MGLCRVLIANRGEIAVRVARAAAAEGLVAVAAFATDEPEVADAPWFDATVALPGTGPAAYLDVDALVEAARSVDADALHPGYGFLSERAELADACEAAGLIFVGPTPATLRRLGDKTQARALAVEVGVPVLEGTGGAVDDEAAVAFLAGLGEGAAVVVKAVAGGGGRGMRVVDDPSHLAEALSRCRSEAEAAFGSAEVYLERLLRPARHVEVQVLGDGTGAVVHVHERECSLQRRHQKVVEVAPAPGLDGGVRAALHAAAVRMAAAVDLRGAATVELLVDAGPGSDGWVFLEANPRLQVEHTVTEEISGLDLVRLQLRIAGGATLADLGLDQDTVPPPRGAAVQARVNAEVVGADGTVRPTGGTIRTLTLPSGPGVRVDTAARAGLSTNPRYDPLLAKVIGHGDDHVAAMARTARALRELDVDGLATNAPLLRRVLEHPDVVAGAVHTTWLEEHLPELVDPEPAASGPAASLAGARVDASDPLAVLHHGKGGGPSAGPASTPAVATVEQGPPGTEGVAAPLQGTIVSVDVAEGDTVRAGQPVAVMEAMKMEHVVEAPVAGTVRRVAVSVGDAVFAAHPLLFVEPGEVEEGEVAAAEEVDLDHVRDDLAEVLDRRDNLLDHRRPEAVARRRKTGQRTARENVDDLVDPGSFVEYGGLTIAAQRRRRELQDLIDRTQADGLVGGIGTVNGDRFAPDRARAVVMSYDYTVLAGTQGGQNHRKKDRLFELAERWRLPVVIFTEGGGGRPGDTDGLGAAGLDCLAFGLFGGLSGLVPLVGINSGRCFAGNAALLGCCDVVIATADSNIGMGGPAMIEGGGLGVFRPEEVGPMDVQVPNGVVDVAVADEAEAVAVARRYLSYFQGRLDSWECADQRLLRSAIPKNRLRIYDVRAVIDLVADTGSVLELRRGFGPGMVTALARIEGRPVGIVANDPTHLAGAIDADAADKSARFLQLCDAHDLPVVFLCDTPGIMVGPESEKEATVRKAARLFVVGASMDVPVVTIVLRKGYGLGAQAMAGGGFKSPMLTVAWPTGEFGGMGLEGAVKLGYRKELAALEDPAERKALYDDMVERSYQRGKALSFATHFEIDDVIDPLDTRTVIVAELEAAGPPPARTGKKRPCIDTW